MQSNQSDEERLARADAAYTAIVAAYKALAVKSAPEHIVTIVEHTPELIDALELQAETIGELTSIIATYERRAPGLARELRGETTIVLHNNDAEHDAS